MGREQLSTIATTVDTVKRTAQEKWIDLLEGFRRCLYGWRLFEHSLLGCKAGRFSAKCFPTAGGAEGSLVIAVRCRSGSISRSGDPSQFFACKIFFDYSHVAKVPSVGCQYQYWAVFIGLSLDVNIIAPADFFGGKAGEEEQKR